MKLKTVLENVTIVVPVFRSIKAIVDCIKVIRQFNTTSKEVVAARDEIVSQMKSIKEVLEQLNDFGKVN